MGDEACPVECSIKNCSFDFSKICGGLAFMHICNYEKITLKNVEISNIVNAPLILRWSEGQVEHENLMLPDPAPLLIKDADTDFQCRPI